MAEAAFPEEDEQMTEAEIQAAIKAIEDLKLTTGPDIPLNLGPITRVIAIAALRAAEDVRNAGVYNDR